MKTDTQKNTFRTAETAAALMYHFAETVTRQVEGSDSAMRELHEAATTAIGNGFPSVWQWVAELAVRAPEDLWASGEIDFLDHVELAAQEFHNRITLPQDAASFDLAKLCDAVWTATTAQLRPTYRIKRFYAPGSGSRNTPW